MTRKKQLITIPQFFGQFIARPGSTGAVLPSSRALAEMITSQVDLRGAATAVEFGPGTGVFTEVIREKIPPLTTFLAIEINPLFVRILKDKYPDLHIYEDSIENTRQYLEKHGRANCDCIISGLPWAAFGEELQNRLLDVVADVLKPQGVFVTFAYLQGTWLKSGRRFRQKINQRFTTVTTSPIVWRNFPPAFVYKAIK